MQKSIGNNVPSTTILLFFFFAFSACQDDDLSEGIDSLRGDWEVIDIQTIYNVTQADGSRETFRVSEDGNLGQFVFSDDTVTFWFIRNDTTYQGAERWFLRKDRVNEGFFRVNRFTLEIENSFSFECEFEDNTKDAQKNADNVKLRNESEEAGTSIWFELSLSKK